MKIVKRFKVLPLILISIFVFSSVAPAFATDPMDVWKLVYSGHSTNGIKIRDVAYGNNVYVGVGSPGMLYYSLDGQKWNSREYSLARNLNAVCYANNKFVAVGDEQSAVSNDGITWTFHDLSETSEFIMFDIAFGNGYFVAVGQKNRTDKHQQIMTSVDGKNWNAVNSSYDVYKDGKLRNFTNVIFANGEFLVVGEQPSVIHLTGNPDDTANWKKVNIDIGGYEYFTVNCIAYGNGIYLALGTYGRVLRSNDAYSWNEVVPMKELGIADRYRETLTYGNGIFVIKSDEMLYPNEQIILSSPDGKAWTKGAMISGPDESLRLEGIQAIQNRMYGFGMYASVFRTEPLVSPTNPMILSATAKGTAISVFWRKSLDATGYKVYRTTSMHTLIGGYSHVATLGSDASIYMDSNLEAGKTYYYKIQAYNNYGVSPYSDVVSATALTEITPIIKPGEFTIISVRPTAPSGLFASALSQTDILLQWQDQSDMELGFEIERRPVGGFYVPVAMVGQNVTSYTDTALKVGTTYQYRVRAYTKDKESDYSNEAQATTQPRMYINPALTIPLPEIAPLDDVVLKFYINQKNYIVNDQSKAMDVEPIILEGRTLLPIRYVAEPLGADVDWDPIDRRATVSLGEKKIELWLGQNLARVNGIPQMIDEANPNVVPISVPPGRTMLPIRFIVESLGFGVDWDPITSEVMITK